MNVEGDDALNLGRALERAAVKQTVQVVCAAVVIAAAAMVLSGCQKPLLAETDERTPYDRYDAIRNQAADQYVFDEYGRRRPNLKDRLMPRD